MNLDLSKLEKEGAEEPCSSAQSGKCMVELVLEFHHKLAKLALAKHGLQRAERRDQA